MARKIGCLLLLLLACSPAFAAGVGIVSGYVTNSAGTPQLGAVVDIFTSAATWGTTVFTDAKGHYEAGNLPPGKYQIKVTAVSFLPSLRENVKVNAGAHVLVNLTLSTLADAVKLPPRRTSETETDDWNWTLRSSANRPVLRVLEKDKDEGSLVVVSRSDPEGSANSPLKARLAFIAGGQAAGFGSAGDVTTAFALEKSLFSSGMLSLNGNIGASTGDPSGVIRASYAHRIGDASRPALTITYRHFAAPGAAVENSPYAALEMNTSDTMSVAGIVDLQYGADLQTLVFARRVTALRPYGAVQVHLSPDLVVQYRYATSEPDSRAVKGFDSAPADLSESGPRMALTNGVPEVERARHQEVSVSRRFGKTSVQAACYVDHVRNLVLTGAGDPTAYSDDVLPDVYSGTFSYAYGSTLNTVGARLVLERKLSDELTITVDYSTGDAVTSESAATWQDLPQVLSTSRQHAVGTKFAGYIPVSGTRWIASYKWTSGGALSAVDAFNASPGQTDPFFSIFIRQPLPGAGFIPAKMDALLDLRNLLAQGYMPVVGQDGRTLYMVQSARALRGGVSFTF
ncbi:MAG TPA: carboxypeptidase-like regulatory domain-containing protein [Candidatus Angelobacter sp.]